MGKAAALPYRYRAALPRRHQARTCCAAPSLIPRPTNLMHESEIRPILRARHQSGAHRILPDVLPFLRVALAVTHSMMKYARLKRPCVQMCFGKAVFPETNPSFDREFQITRRAEEMQVIRHQQVITHDPCGSGVSPDVVQRALNGGLRQPAFTLLGSWRSSTNGPVNRKDFRWGRAAALPYQIAVGRRCRAAQNPARRSTAPNGTNRNEFEPCGTADLAAPHTVPTDEVFCLSEMQFP